MYKTTVPRKQSPHGACLNYAVSFTCPQCVFLARREPKKMGDNPHRSPVVTTNTVRFLIQHVLAIVAQMSPASKLDKGKAKVTCTTLCVHGCMKAISIQGCTSVYRSTRNPQRGYLPAVLFLLQLDNLVHEEQDSRRDTSVGLSAGPACTMQLYLSHCRLGSGCARTLQALCRVYP